MFMKKSLLVFLLACLSVWAMPNAGYSQCTPSFVYASAACTTYGYTIGLFTLNGHSGTTIVDSANCTGSGYQNFYGADSVLVQQGGTYTAGLSYAPGGYSSMNGQVYIDFNNNTTFESSESVGGLNAYTSYTTFSVTIPASAALGTHRMRVITCDHYSGSYPTINPCGGSGMEYGEGRDYQVRVVATASCSGTPSAGTATSTLPTVCPSLSFTLNLSGSTSASGLTYQWQSSPDGSTWTTMSGATTVSYATTETSAKYYRCSVSCSGSSAFSSPVFVNYASACYCSPTFSSASTGCTSYRMSISRFTLNGASSTSILDTATCNGTGYMDMTSMSCSLVQATTYTASVQTTSSYALNTQTWIDFNDNGTFESSESVGGSNTFTGIRPYSIAVPSSATLGSHRMRVFVVYSTPSYPSINPCGGSSYYYGEARDYTVNIIPPPVITLAPTSLSFGTVTVGSCSSASYFTVTGTYLTPSSGTVTVTAPAGYSVSGTVGASSWVSSYTISYTGGTISSTNIYVQFCPSSATAYSGCVTVTGGGTSASTCGSVSGTGGSVCSGTPTGGTATASPASGDSSTTVTLSLSGASTSGGITYQWQSAASSGGTYTNISGATNSTYNFSGISANTCYRCVVACPYTSTSANSSVSCVTYTGGTTCTTITTIAGSGTNGHSGDGGAATAATLAGLSSVVADASGNVYMVDAYNNIVRKISTSGIITLFAGSAGGGYSGDGGAATAATLSGCNGLAMDASGNLYISDASNYRVRKVNTSGVISTFAGNGTTGYSGDGGAATAAKLGIITSVACDASGNVYISDYGNSRIRKVNSSGIISTYAGTGTSGFSGDGGAATAANISNVASIATDGAGNLYLLDNTNHRLRKVNTSGIISTVAGTGSSGSGGDGGPATAAQLNRPSGVFVSNAGNIYISDQYNNRVRRINTSGIITSVAGTGTSGFSGDGGAATAAMLNLPTSVTTDASGNIIIGEYSNYRIRKVTGGAPSVAAISGPTTVCVGSVITLTDATSGGIWVTSTPGIATVGMGTGLVTGVTAGTAFITYSVTSSCGTTDVAQTVTVIAGSSSAGTISGPSSVCVGASITLADSVSGGSWSSANTSIATVASSGVVTGVSAGTVVISYSISGSCGTVVATKTITVGGAPSVAAITGTPAVCVGATTTLTDVTSGGVWTSTSTSVATVSASSGVVTGVSAGTTTISYTLTNSCGTSSSSVTVTVTAAPATPGSISGPTAVCVGGSVTLTDATSGGVWSSGTSSIITIGSSTGVATGVAAGTATISYTISNSCGTVSATRGIVVTAPPATPAIITGTTTICAGATATLSDATTGGTWSSSATSVATISASGVVTGISAGTATISYTVTNSCGSTSRTTTMVVNAATTIGAISGASSVCTGVTTTLTDATTGGTWSSSNASIASVNSAGVVTGVAVGTATISYAVTGSCGTMTVTKSMVVNASPNAGTISGASTACTGTTITLTNSVSGGTWTSSNPSLATVSTGGIVIPVAAGTVTISYSVTGICGTAVATKSITVSAAPSAGSITGASSVCAGLSTVLVDTTSGGTWSTSNASIASVNSSGTVTGVSAGSVIISYTNSNACGTASAAKGMTVGSLPSAGTLSGPTVVCTGTTITLTSSATGGTWLSSNTAVATVVASTGVVRGVTGGTVTITYYVSSTCATAIATRSIAVAASGSAGTISGVAAVCRGASATLSNSVTGGTWSSSNPSVASISTTGVVTGVAAGSVTITYTATSGCGSAFATKAFTVNALPYVSIISGASSVCAGATTTLTDSFSGGGWISSNTAAATITSSGVVTGISSGATIITYFITNGCGTSTKTKALSVTTASAGTISGPSSVAVGANIVLTTTVSGGTWTSRNTSLATVNTTGIVHGVATGTDTVVYTVSTSCGTASLSKVITITAHRGFTGGSSVDEEHGDIKIYPNPNNGAFTLELPEGTANATVVITDISGKVIEVKSNSEQTMYFDMSQFAAGTYLLRVQADGNVYTRKVVIQ